MKKFLVTSALATALSVSALGSVARADDFFQDIRIILKDIFVDLSEIKKNGAYPGPGPVAGVGLPFLLVAGYYAWRRRRKAPPGVSSIDQQPRD
jgi:hypothetical protein